MSKPQRIPASAAKLHFGELLNRCVYGGEEIVITKHDKPVAIIVKFEKNGSGVKSKSADENLPGWFLQARELRQKIKEYQKRHGIKDDVNAVKLVRMIRDEEDYA